MADDKRAPQSDYEREKARVVAEAAAKAAAAFDRDFAEARRLAETYPGMFTFAAGGPPIGGGTTVSMSAAPTRITTLSMSNETVGRLIENYRTHPESGIHKLRHATRMNYDGLLRRLENEIGPILIAVLDEARFRQEHARWSESGQTMAHSLTTMLRIVAAFNAKTLKNPAARELKMTLHDVRFPMLKSRVERLTERQVMDIIKAAHKLGFPSMAKAQALQFYVGLRQKDAAGEYVPHSDPAFSEIHYRGMKWVRGIRWSSIDQNWILRHRASMTQKDLVIDLREYPVVLEQLGSHPQSNSPVIAFEHSGYPYLAHQFRRTWRKIADAAGVPKSIKNMDSRPSEGRPDVASKVEARR
jgi:hypothetical protein